MDEPIQIEEFRTLPALMRVRDEWLKLWRASHRATVFQSPQWLFAWWKHFAESRELWVLTARRNGNLVGVAPLCIESVAGSRDIEGRFIGCGISDYLDFVLADTQSPEIIAAMLDAMFAWTHIDVLILESLPADSPVLSATSRFDSVVAPQDVCPVLTIHSPARTDRSRDTEAIRKLAYYRRRLERTAKFAVEAAERQSFPTFFAALLRLHRERWSLRAESGVLNDSAITQFHREVASQFLEDGRLRLYLLTLDGHAAAVFYGFHHARKTMYYLGGFSPEFKHLNVGTVIVGDAIERAAQEGATEFDFLRGNESYKYAWGATNRLTYRRTIYRNLKAKKANVSADSANA